MLKVSTVQKTLFSSTAETEELTPIGGIGGAYHLWPWLWGTLTFGTVAGMKAASRHVIFEAYRLHTSS